MIDFTNICALTPKEFTGRLTALDEAGAHVITVAVKQNGDLTVLSPFDANWTQHFLLTAGVQLPVAMSVN
jgi:hypothetical protein